MVVEILSSIISLGTTSNHIEKEKGIAGVCHFFAAIDPKIFGDPISIQKHLENYLEEIRCSQKANNHDRVYTHGEKEAEMFMHRKAHGIIINEKTLIEMEELSQELGMDINTYF
jgi:LDH2 family malate/lactate/ureidoglycolate dehydrogenase